jgi:hypothetical protein
MARMARAVVGHGEMQRGEVGGQPRLDPGGA